VENVPEPNIDLLSLHRLFIHLVDAIMVQVAVTSPYAYLATFCFAFSACTSDLLSIRLTLTHGFLFLVLATMSGYSADGSFTTTPLYTDGILDVTMLVNAILFSLNAFICIRLIQDERPYNVQSLTEEEMALFRFFHSRCGVTLLQFRDIRKHGQFLELPAHTEVPDCQRVLYLVLEGKIACEAKFPGNTFGKKFLKRSGQFFDIKLFNLFTIPVGFDAIEFQAKTETTTKLFGWNINGLIAMREATSPSLKHYWEYMVLRAMTAVAVESHLKSTDTLYDSLLVPEHQGWLDGAPSRDFWKRDEPLGNWDSLQRQLEIVRGSLWHVIPPRGVRHQPGMVQPHNPKQAYIELVLKASATDQAAFRFLPQDETATTTKDKKETQREAEEPVGFRFIATNSTRDLEGGDQE
jgi:hypothetical protein